MKSDFIENYDFSSFNVIKVCNDKIIVSNDPINHTEEYIKQLPIPDRSDYDHKKYQNFWIKNEGIKMTSIIMTFGCPFNCDFCSKPIFGSKFRKRNIKDIIIEIKDIISLGYDSIWIADDCFTLDLEFLELFCDSLINNKITIRWNCLSRIDTFSSALLDKMRKSGCYQIYLGLESGNNQVLKIMKKAITIEKVKKAVEQLKNAKIKIGGFFMIGYPGETWESIDQTLNFALELDLDEVSFNIPYPLPGSALYERVINVNLNQDWTIENEIKFVYKSQFDEAIIIKKIRKFYKINKKKNFKNYCRPI